MRWRNLILENLWLKVSALLLASLIWFAASTHLTGNFAWPLAFRQAEAIREFPGRPVLVLGLPTDQRAFVVQPGAASVTLRGPAELVRQLDESAVHVFVRVPNLAGLSAELPLEVHTPRGVSVVGLEPPTVELKAKVGP